MLQRYIVLEFCLWGGSIYRCKRQMIRYLVLLFFIVIRLVLVCYPADLYLGVLCYCQDIWISETIDGPDGHVCFNCLYTHQTGHLAIRHVIALILIYRNIPIMLLSRACHGIHYTFQTEENNNKVCLSQNVTLRLIATNKSACVCISWTYQSSF